MRMGMLLYKTSKAENLKTTTNQKEQKKVKEISSKTGKKARSLSVTLSPSKPSFFRRNRTASDFRNPMASVPLGSKTKNKSTPRKIQVGPAPPSPIIVVKVKPAMDILQEVQDLEADVRIWLLLLCAFSCEIEMLPMQRLHFSFSFNCALASFVFPASFGLSFIGALALFVIQNKLHLCLASI